MGQFAVGQVVPREEDPRLLKGLGRFLDDVVLPQQSYAHVLRSPHAHARIRSIDSAAAAALPGVLAVLTGADYAGDGLGNVPCEVLRPRRDGSAMYHPPYAPLVTDRVRRVGDCVAIVVAETVTRAKDAAELIEVDYEPLPAVSSVAEAVESGAPLVWDDCPGNESWYMELGDRAKTDAVFATADRTMAKRFFISRITANTMEPRGCLGDYDRYDDRFTLYTGLQNPHQVREYLAHEIFRLPETKFRVIAYDIGGSFGMKGGLYPEIPLVLWASKRIGRPVKWVCERSDGLMSDDHARDNVSGVELAYTDQGKLLGMRVQTLANMGAYLAIRGTMPPINNLGTLAGPYTTDAIHVGVSGVLTNTNSTAPYRGAGRPEAAYIIERMVEFVADDLGLDAVEVRRRNYIPPHTLPYKTGLLFTYDSGEFENNMDTALGMIDHMAFETRRADSRSHGKLRGFGISNTIEQAAAPNPETAELRFDASGTLTLLMGTVSHGQGHDTIYKQIVCEKLGIDSAQVRVVEGDTDKVTYGRGTFGSRSAATGGTAIVLAADKVIEKGRKIAAHMLEAADSDIAFDAGVFVVAGTDRSLDLIEAAKTAYQPAKLPPEIEPGLDEIAQYFPTAPTFPNGCHICEVEVDEETGVVEVVRYVVVDDVGTVINPLLLKGQIHGGVAQGLGQALMERIVFADDSGQLVTGSFMDYCMPRADDMTPIDVESNGVPTDVNPLGVKGAGEAGTVGALPAVMNAVIDALKPLGIRDLDMPATSERVWRAIGEAKQ